MRVQKTCVRSKTVDGRIRVLNSRTTDQASNQSYDQSQSGRTYVTTMADRRGKSRLVLPSEKLQRECDPVI